MRRKVSAPFSPDAAHERTRRGTGAHSRIQAVVGRIPKGCVATYGQVAALAGFPGKPRLAGYALHALPDGTPLPWHRVLGAGGRLSLAKLDPAAATTQRLRLEREGVRFDARARVDLECFQWRPGNRGTGRRTSSTRNIEPAIRRPAGRENRRTLRNSRRSGAAGQG